MDFRRLESMTLTIFYLSGHVGYQPVVYGIRAEISAPGGTLTAILDS